MKSVTCKFLFFVFLMAYGFRVHAQVLPQDSLALVALYNSTNGSNWLSKANWLTTRVGLWDGVGIVGNRVQTLSLGNNNLIGTLPNEFCDLSGMEYLYLNNNHLSGNLPSCIGNAVSINSIDLRNNQFTGAFPAAFATAMPDLADVWISNNKFTDFPDLTGVVELSNLHVDGNLLTFEDIVPNVSIPNIGYVYAPQLDSDQNSGDLLLEIFDPFSVQVIVGGTNNTYQWQSNFIDIVDDVHVSGANSAVLANNGAQVSDGGFYTCKVSNPSAPLLTIRVISHRVDVVDNRLPQSYNFPQDTSMFCGIDSMVFPNQSAQSVPLTFQALNGGYIASNSVYYGNRPTVALVRVYNDGDTTHLPFADTVRVAVLTQHPVPAFTISNDLPLYEDEELTLTVQDIAGVSYSWTTPDLQNEQTNSITRPAGSPLMEGIYKVRIYEGNCLYDTLRIAVSLSVDSNIVIYELITPNGDGDNETFYIKNIEALPSAHITIFNVWHQVVYNQEHYQNEWDGGGLPVGTYYYLLKVEEWDKTYKGSLYIKR